MLLRKPNVGRAILSDRVFDDLLPSLAGLVRSKLFNQGFGASSLRQKCSKKPQTTVSVGHWMRQPFILEHDEQFIAQGTNLGFNKSVGSRSKVVSDNVWNRTAITECSKLCRLESTKPSLDRLEGIGAASSKPFRDRVWNRTSSVERNPLGDFMSARARVSCLHTEIKEERKDKKKKSVLDDLEKSSKLKRVKSSDDEKVSMRKILGSVSRASDKRPNNESVRANQSDFVSASSKYVQKEPVAMSVHVPTELRSFDHQEVQKSFSEEEEVARQTELVLDKYEVQNLTIEELERRNPIASEQAMALLRAALDEVDEGDGTIAKEFQRSLRVGIVGAPNAGKSLLTNQLVGSRVSAVSRKTNTTHREHLGVFTKDDTQLLYYDTPGLHLDIEGSPLRVDAQHRVRNAWEIVDFCEALVVLVDAERQIRRPDKRVKRLVEKLGTEQIVSQKRVLCLNKVDIIEQKRQLLPLAKEFEDMVGFDRIFMISGLTGSGVKDVKDYLLSQAVLRPWDEDPDLKNHRDIALEIVREQVFEHLHEELPHTTRQKLVSWKVLNDGSVRIQQLLLVAKKEHQKILVGKNGAVIGDIGIKARKELQTILGVTVHLVLDVKLMTDYE